MARLYSDGKLSRSIEADPSKPSSRLSIYHFAPLKTSEDKKKMKEELEREQQLGNEATVGQNDHHRAPRDLVLAKHGRVETLQDAVSMGKNYKTLSLTVVNMAVQPASVETQCIDRIISLC